MIWSVVAFILIGIIGGMVFNNERTSTLLHLILGLAGSMGFSYLAKLIDLGSGFTAFSLWGIVFGAAGAILLPMMYNLLARD